MPVKILCPNPDCGASYSILDENLGRIGRCKHCGTEFPLVPGTQAASPPISGLDSSPASAEAALPESFGRYKVLGMLGRGGMGSVYLAHDAQLDRQVALKVPHLSAFGNQPEVRQRFLREARAAARFRHPSFCPIFDIGEVDGVPFLAMAFIKGQTLSASIEVDQGWPPRRAAEVARDLARALAEAHREGIIHRDLKPANVMVDDRGGLVLMDFGLARWHDDLDPTFTPTGAILGTPAYMPPEQAEGNLKAVGPRSDIYSLGVILYELLTGRRPFEGSLTKILGMIAFAQPPPPSDHRPGLDPRLEAICLRAMAKKPEDRYASMDEFAGVLQGWLDETRRTGPDRPGESSAQEPPRTRGVDLGIVTSPDRGGPVPGSGVSSGARTTLPLSSSNTTLIPCPGCHKPVSPKAPACPRCGYSIAKPSPPADPSYWPPLPPSTMPPTYLVQAILATLFCCMPLGVVAIVKSSQVSAAFGVGDHELARLRSKQASSWVMISVGAGVAIVFVYMFIGIAANLGR